MHDGITLHAEARMHQRAISAQAVDLILEFGDLIRHAGADVYALNHRSRNALRRHLGRREYLRLEPQFDAYVVFIDGWICTVAHRLGRLKHKVH
jgi:RimJ/RimL family protein N-acetyltransferase